MDLREFRHRNSGVGRLVFHGSSEVEAAGKSKRTAWEKKKNISEGKLADGSAGVLRGFSERADATLIQGGGGGRWAAFEGRLSSLTGRLFFYLPGIPLAKISF